MPRARLVAAALSAVLAGCAGRAASAPDPGELAFFDLQARLAARGAGWVGHRGDFRAAGERFLDDCTGFIQAVYEAEGIPLRALMRRAAPDERVGVAAAWRAMQEYGTVFGAGGEWPAPGDLVFWHDTYDRNRNGKADDPFTHVGIVEYVVDGTVVFVHRGGKTVARGAMNPARPNDVALDGVRVNSPIRARNPRLEKTPSLAGALFAGYGRIDPGKIDVR